VSQTEKSHNETEATRCDEIKNAVDKVLADDSWSWEEEKEDEKQGDMTDTVDARVLLNNSNSRSDPVATMLDRLYGGDDHASRFRAAPDQNRRWDRFADRYYDRYSNRNDLVTEWKRDALSILPKHFSLKDGDQVIRIDGEDNNGMLVYDLASCR